MMLKHPVSANVHRNLLAVGFWLKSPSCSFWLGSLLAALSSCSQTNDNARADYELRIGETFSINMSANPSTGYQWQWPDRARITMLDTLETRYVPSRPGIVGSGGVETWVFQGLQPGFDTIRLAYFRPHEPENTAEELQFTVRVKK